MMLNWLPLWTRLDPASARAARDGDEARTEEQHRARLRHRRGVDQLGPNKARRTSPDISDFGSHEHAVRILEERREIVRKRRIWITEPQISVAADPPLRERA